MRAKGFVGSALLFIACWGSGIACSQQRVVFDMVYVEATFNSGATSSVGNGLLARSAEGCVVIAPLHVVQAQSLSDRSMLDPDKIKLVTKNGQQFSAELQRALASDIAVLSTNISANACAPAPPVSGIEAMVEQALDGALVRVTPSGGLERQFVRLTGVLADVVRIAPESNAPTIGKGMSGSMLVAGDRPIGLLLQHGESDNKVLRLDKIKALVGAAWVSSPRAGTAGGDAIVVPGQQRVTMELQITRRTNQNGEQWDANAAPVPRFLPPDPMVFITFQDGRGMLVGYERVTELSPEALRSVGMAWQDPCSNRFDCVIANVPVYGDLLESVQVFDYDPQIDSGATWEEFGTVEKCKFDVPCKFDGGVVTFHTGSRGPAPTAPPVAPRIFRRLGQQ